MKTSLVRAAAAIALAFCFLAGSWAGAEPVRKNGMSVHAIPQRVAEQDTTHKVHWGYLVSLPGDMRSPLKHPAFQTAESLVDYWRQQPRTVQENGIWVVFTHPTAYNDGEKAEWMRLKKICLDEKIPLFVTRARNLPNGWHPVTDAEGFL